MPGEFDSGVLVEKDGPAFWRWFVRREGRLSAFPLQDIPLTERERLREQISEQPEPDYRATQEEVERIRYSRRHCQQADQP